jgi:hypothetical protein
MVCKWQSHLEDQHGNETSNIVTQDGNLLGNRKW